MSDVLFGVTVPEYAPIGVFPCDPDFNFKRGRKWNTIIHRFSPLIEQRFISSASPLVNFQIGFSAMKGTFFQDSTKFRDLWEFFNAHQGRGVPFYYYDPSNWGFWPHSPDPEDNYRDDPTKRPNFSGSQEYRGITFTSTLDRYIVVFDTDELSIDLFEAKLRRTDLKLTGYAG